jgi:hypothetical protein
MKAEDQYDLIGNTPRLWFESAMNLLMASAEIASASRKAAAKLKVPMTRSFWPRLMIRAFALECLIKAHHLRSGEKLCVGGEYRGIVKSEKHQLQKLARHVGIPISVNEAHMLDRLSAVAVGSGRYPIFTKFDAPRSFGKNERLRIQWQTPADEVVFHAFLKRLVTPFDPQAQYDFLTEEA